MADEPTIKARRVIRTGLVTENAVLRQMLGLCPTLAVTTAVTNGLGMGLATTFVLVCSEVVVAALRNVIPDRVRMPAFITIIASFVTLTMMVVEAWLPALNDSLGVYLSLIVVNCIVLGRAEVFASRHTVGLAALDGLSMGAGFTLALTAMSALRELLGAGTLAGVQVLPASADPMLVMLTPTGGFAALAALVALAAFVSAKRHAPKGPKGPQETLCAACPLDCKQGLEHVERAIEEDAQVKRLKARMERDRAARQKGGSDAC